MTLASALSSFFFKTTALNFAMNFNYFLSDSFLVFLDQLLMAKIMPPWYRILVVTTSLYLPKFGVQLLTPFANRWGLHAMLTIVIRMSVGVGVVALLCGEFLCFLLYSSLCHIFFFFIYYLLLSIQLMYFVSDCIWFV